MKNSVAHDTWHDIIDYAGLFPPAGLSLTTTLSNYAEYARSSERWLLGRLILPLGRLAELPAATTMPEGPISCLWPAETLSSETAIEEALAQTEMQQSVAGRGIDSIEVAAGATEDIIRLAKKQSSAFRWFVEVPLNEQLPGRLDAIHNGGLLAKVRTGSIRPAEIPSSQSLAEFLRAAGERRLGFKCTAGLHHPFPAVRPLTYELHAPRGRMHGFVNVLMATAVARYRGGSPSRLQQILEDEEASHFRWTDAGLRWQELVLSPRELADTRNQAFLSFGSCSFREPVDDLRAIHWLDPGV